MNHWLSFFDYSPAQISALVNRASEIKKGGFSKVLNGKVGTLMFFNQSLRTRVSFEVAIHKMGGAAISLSPGNDTWGFEVEDGVVMNSDKAEHIEEAVKVLCRYNDFIGVRTFAKLDNISADFQEIVLNSFKKYASVPIINLESAMEHPCQALADMLTIKEKLGAVQSAPHSKNFVLSWAPHVKALPMAVPHSALLAAAYSGMNITLAHPKGYELHSHYIEKVKAVCKQFNTSFEYTDNQVPACKNSDILYVKSWGSSQLYQNNEAQTADFNKNKNWCVTKDHFGPRTHLMHCLPVRRDVVVTAEALRDKQSIIIDQAENRLWAQSAILENIFKQ